MGPSDLTPSRRAGPAGSRPGPASGSSAGTGSPTSSSGARAGPRFAEALAAGGVEVANDVVLNQVLVGFGDDARTDRVIAGVQRDGTCWLGGTTWRGRRLMRISVSNWSTTEADVDRSVEAILRVAAAV